MEIEYMNSKERGNEGEKFVFNYLVQLGYVVEIHPRTSRPVFLHGKTIYVSSDNDYHNNFDVKAERADGMIYAQVKVEAKKSNISTAQKNIDHDYPYQFPYQRIQTWQLWKEWEKNEKGYRHKVFKVRIQERHGFSGSMWKINGESFPKGIWTEIISLS